MKFNDVKSYITHTYRAGLRRTIYLQGPPGCGKTACAEQAAKDLKISSIAWPMTVIDPLDLGGMPAVLDAGDGAYAARLPFSDLIPHDGAGILILDDLPTAPPLTQASAYRLIWERQIGRAKLGDDWLIVATGNRAQDRAAVNPIPTPLVSKMGWLDFEPDLDGWLLHMSATGASTVACAFLLSAPQHFVTFDPARPGPFASARTWEAVSELMLAYAPSLPPYEAIAGWVGEAVATPFVAYATMAAQLVSPAEILRDPVHAPVPDNPGALWAVTTALSSIARPNNLTAICTYLDRLSDEYAIYTMRMAIKADEARNANLSPEEIKRRGGRLWENNTAFSKFAASRTELLSNI